MLKILMNIFLAASLMYVGLYNAPLSQSFEIHGGPKSASPAAPNAPAEKKANCIVNRPGVHAGIEIPITPPAEFDFLSKKEIYRRRTDRVKKFPQLCDVYTPSNEVFGGIESGKSWWGLIGVSFYGNGVNSIQGDSEESRFILNPYLLAGLSEPYVYDINSRSFNLKPKAIYPLPVRLAWNGNGTSAHAWYNVSTFFEDCRTYHHSDTVKEQRFNLIMYNARDLGLPYCAVDSASSRNISSGLSDGQAHSIPFMLHCGHSSGYPGGSNNMSPGAPEFDVTLKSLPAEVVIKLWRQKPNSVRAPADVTFTISME